MHAGIDEAGRGPVLGPLVVAGVSTADPDLLWGLGCQDSKRLSAGKRERLARLLRDHPDVRHALVVIAPETIDEKRATMSLNAIEVEAFAEVAKVLAPKTLMADAADVDAARFARNLADRLPGVDVRAEHQADGNHATVAAASILAKVARDSAITDLARRLERRLEMPVGSGYPSDPTTRAFLATWVDRFGSLPPGTRTSWKTATDLVGPKATRLQDFEA